MTPASEAAMAGEYSKPRTFAAKIDRCFITMYPIARGPWTYEEVSAGMADLGVSCSPSYLRRLRVGEEGSPTSREVEALAAFFNVPMTFFIGNEREIDEFDAQMVIVRALRNPELRDRILDLTENLTCGDVVAVAETVRHLETD